MYKGNHGWAWSKEIIIWPDQLWLWQSDAYIRWCTWGRPSKPHPYVVHLVWWQHMFHWHIKNGVCEVSHQGTQSGT